MLIGYARVSTDDQKLHLQRDALKAAGCGRVFEDRGLSGADARRPGLATALDAVGEGDTLVVWRLDRLGRSMTDLLALVEGLRQKGAGFRSLMEAMDTTTPGGELVFHVFAALAQFERRLTVERVRAGLAAARLRGRVGGRPPKLSPAQLDHARALIGRGEHSLSQTARLLGVHPSTLCRALKQQAPEHAESGTVGLKGDIALSVQME